MHQGRVSRRHEYRHPENRNGKTPFRQTHNPCRHACKAHGTLVGRTPLSFILSEQIFFAAQGNFCQNASIRHRHVCALPAAGVSGEIFRTDITGALADDFRTLVATQDLLDLPPIPVSHYTESPQHGF